MNDQNTQAIDSLMRYLAARDHSELELRNKLKRRYEPEAIEAAITYAHEHALLLAPEELAMKASRELARRKKSHGYIQNQLRKRGLPSVSLDSEGETEKMRRLLNGKFGSEGVLTYEEKTKAYRFLKYRGF